MTSIPKDFPKVYVSSIGVNSIVLLGDSKKLIENYSTYRSESRKVGGVWGDHEIVVNYFNFKNDLLRNQCIQTLIDKTVAFSIHDRKNPDAFRKALNLRDEKKVEGEILGVEILVSNEITVHYQMN
ncbi:hypothetical protein [Marinimicrobium sp. LS-A18]|uniref:hypothetical protein n=1 Tax=Marinimicrobium sp. LS-A18 TaxID=1381596 RepID=UPI0012684793|nr:hypothetical protein [Marinimicrobium sp. LS-A18]